MPHYRSNEEQNRYEAHYKKADGKGCPFCLLDETEIVAHFENFTLLRNIFPYSIWDGCEVLDHLMVVPKKHVESLSLLGTSEQLEYMKLVGEYESKGYNVYSRALKSGIKSVPHQHTHLIKISPERIKGLTYTEKPYHREIHT